MATRPPTVDTSREGAEPVDFETAERRLFDAYGLETRSRFVELAAPRIRTHVFEATTQDSAGGIGDSVTGARDAHTPMLFVHGTGSFGAVFAPLMAQLDDVRLIAFDRPGYGHSDPFEYTEANVRETLVDVVEGVLDELAIDRVDLVGHSMGGHASILFALAHPDRVRRLFVLGAIPAFPGTRPPIQLRLLTVPLLHRVLRRLQRPGIEGALDVAEIFGERETITDHPALLRALAAHEGEPKAAATTVSEFNALLSVRGWHRSVRLGEAQLRSLAHPTTVVWGDHDTLGGPDDVRDAIAYIEDVRFEPVTAGHIPFLAHAERCATLLRENASSHH